jgi:uncharacterized RDD family membrane protein YckC
MDALDQEIFDTEVQQYFEASKDKRIANFIIDYIVYLSLTFVTGAFIGIVLVMIFGDDFFLTFDEESVSARLIDYAIGALVMFIYYSAVEYYSNGKSLGKLITKTRAVQRSGEDMTFGIAIKRSACRLIPFNPFSFLGDLRNGWHDSIPNTKVIDEKRPIVQYTRGKEVQPVEYDFLKKTENQ